MAARSSLSLRSLVLLRGGEGPWDLYLMQLILVLSRFLFRSRALLDLGIFDDSETWRLWLCEGACFLHTSTMMLSNRSQATS